MTDLPIQLQARLSGYACESDTIGCSTADVRKFSSATETLYLKSDSNVAALRREREVLTWLVDKVPIPQVVEWLEAGGRAYLLMTAADGHMSCSYDDYDTISFPPEKTVELLADGLKILQSVEIETCPFNNSLRLKLSQALHNIEHGLVDMDDFEDGNDFNTPMELYDWLSANQPPEELCFCHGDYCLPNIFVNGERVTAFIDVNNAGIADKWQDIALCMRSLGYNLGQNGCGSEKDRYIAQLFEHLDIAPDWDKINYYILLDELF